MTNQFQVALKEAQFKQVALWETCFTINYWKGTSTWYWWDLNYLLIYGEKWDWNTLVIDNMFYF